MERREILAVLASAGQSPQHRYGQNFMIDLKALQAIVDAGELSESDLVLEVGPGVGNLTRLLAQRAGGVLAVDIDEPLMRAAQRHLPPELSERVTWMHCDVLEGKHQVEPKVLSSLAELMAAKGFQSLKLVSNLPYNAASPLIAELLVEQWRRAKSAAPLNWSSLSFTVQWEVGQRMAAPVDSSDFGPLGILIQLLARVEILRKIPPGCFWPAPKIHSALVRVRPDPEKMAQVLDAVLIQKMLAGLFSHRRQQLANALRHWLDGEHPREVIHQLLETLALDPAVRPEAVPPERFEALSELLRTRGYV